MGNKLAMNIVKSRVLIAYENDSSGSELVSILKPLQLEIDEVQDGEEVLRLVTDRDYDAVLMDVHVPGMNGLQICSHIRRKLAMTELPIIMMISPDESSFVSEVLASGASDFVHKPFNADEVRARTRGVIMRRRAECALRQASRGQVRVYRQPQS